MLGVSKDLAALIVISSSPDRGYLYMRLHLLPHFLNFKVGRICKADTHIRIPNLSEKKCVRGDGNKAMPYQLEF